MNLKTIADAIAARFVAVVATNGTETETATASADMPDSVGTLALIVYPPTGSLLIETGATLRDQYDFPVKLLRDPISMPARSQWLLAWGTALRGRVELDMDLGLPTIVEQAEATDIELRIDGEPYASADGTRRDFDVVELTVHVQINEVDFPIGA